MNLPDSLVYFQIVKEQDTMPGVRSIRSGAGYWLPKDKEEIRKFCETMEKRARNTFNATKSARRALELPEGQLDITE